MKIMKRIVPMLMALTLVFTMMPMAGAEVYAKGDTPSVAKSGDLYSFVKDAPITTVRIDGSKLTKDYANLTYQMNARYSKKQI